MHRHKRICGCFAFLLTVAVFMPAVGQEPQEQPQSKTDNSKVNKRDRSRSEPTADQQKESRPDRETARQIRRSIVADKSLSTYAHNVKIIAEHGKVTLKGPVRSEEEKEAVLAKAAEVAGKNNINDQVTVVAKKDKDKD